MLAMKYEINNDYLETVGVTVIIKDKRTKNKHLHTICKKLLYSKLSKFI